MSVGRSVKQHIAREGRSVTITNYTEDSSNSYGDTTYTTATSTENALVEMAGSEDMVRNAQGQSVTLDATIYLPDTVSVNDTWDGKRSEIDHDGKTYEVVAEENQGNGITKCLCQRKRS